MEGINMANWLAAIGEATPALTKTWKTIQEENRLQKAASEESAIRSMSLQKLQREEEWNTGNVQVTPGQTGQPAPSAPLAPGQPAMGTPAESPANFAQSPYDVPGTVEPQRAISPAAVAQQQQRVEAQKQQEAARQEPVAIGAHPGFMQFSTNPDAQKTIIDGLASMGAIDPRTGTGPRWKIQKGLEALSKNEEFVKKVLVDTGKMYITQANDLTEKINKLEEDKEHLTANGPKIAEYKSQRAVLVGKATPLLDAGTKLFEMQKNIVTLGARVDAMKKSGEWNAIPAPVRNEFETAASDGNEKMWQSAGDKWITLKENVVKIDHVVPLGDRTEIYMSNNTVITRPVGWKPGEAEMLSVRQEANRLRAAQIVQTGQIAANELNFKKAGGGKAENIKANLVRGMWDTWSVDEKKKYLGVYIPNNGLKDKELLSINTNMLTDPRQRVELAPRVKAMLERYDKRVAAEERGVVTPAPAKIKSPISKKEWIRRAGLLPQNKGVSPQDLGAAFDERYTE
jgi:hypothetical protein